MIELTLVQKIVIWIIPILFAVTLHEAAHGFVAYRLGDNTAKEMGRISLNPFKHIDPLGTVIIPLILLATSGFVFGWAKPVPVEPSNLKHPKRDFALVAVAGPLANFAMAVLWMLVLKLGFTLVNNKVGYGIPVLLMGQAGVLINLILMVLNLLPIPPLDGSRVFTYLLPAPWDTKYNQFPPLYGFLLIVLLIVSGLLSKIMLPVIQMIFNFLLILFAIKPG